MTPKHILVFAIQFYHSIQADNTNLLLVHFKGPEQNILVYLNHSIQADNTILLTNLSNY